MNRIVCSVAACLGFMAAPVLGQQAAIDRVQQRVVKVFGAGGLRNLNAYSSGFLVDERGFVVTVWNHVLDTAELTIVLHDGRRYAADVVAAEPALDLAVLKLEAAVDEKFPFFPLADVRDIEPGSRVLAFSNMFKVATGDEPVTVLHGVVSAKTRLAARRGVFEVPFESELYIVDAITNNAGSEGGVLTTRSGTPVAMIGRQLRNGETNTYVNYGVPLTELRDTVAQIIAGNYSARSGSSKTDEKSGLTPGHLGLIMVPDVVQRTPGYVDSVIPRSAAAQAGVRREDLVVFVNDRLVRSCAELREALNTISPGQKLELIVRRGDVLKTFKMTVPREGRTGSK